MDYVSTPFIEGTILLDSLAGIATFVIIIPIEIQSNMLKISSRCYFPILHWLIPLKYSNFSFFTILSILQCWFEVLNRVFELLTIIKYLLRWLWECPRASIVVLCLELWFLDQ